MSTPPSSISKTLLIMLAFIGSIGLFIKFTSDAACHIYIIIRLFQKQSVPHVAAIWSFDIALFCQLFAMFDIYVIILITLAAVQLFAVFSICFVIGS